ncbi:MAG: tRNA (guanosine(46)-N7)-methyltransferase TrmB [Rhodospirillaceae bacterium]|nr:tRNA (guanosine(46)-N7)-methyltransferase TrmB [Rhodospirillaceae bacterium]
MALNLTSNRDPYQLHLYGRRKGKPLKKNSQLIFDRDFPTFSITAEEVVTQETTEWFQSEGIKSVWLEIGFGSGENIIELARRNPKVGFIGIEVFHNGIAALLKHRADHNLKNLRVFNGDARHLLQVLPKNSVENVFILYPDPWPKARHYKRRLICKETLDNLKDVMKIGFQLHLATDHPTYIEWCLKQIPCHPHFKWRVTSPKSWTTPAPYTIATRYEKKAMRQGRRPIYLTFDRI